VDRAIVEDPPVSARDGGVIKAGFDARLDELRSISTSSKQRIAELQQREREKTGIKSLKIGYNQVFGYYIEVTKPNLHLVPPYYERKQTTSNAERFTIPELREKEALVYSVDEKRIALEYELFQNVVQFIFKYLDELQLIARCIGSLDVYLSLAEVAVRNNYVRPVVDESDRIVIRDGRHPIVERKVQGFVPNDTLLDLSENQLLVITGANMAGKSTYMRQVALICILAQMGSFVPASYASIGIVDRIFTRVGAFDDLASGQSTFMVEMIELANILNNVTPRSLVILDEIGRGTSTLDGYSIAKAVLEYLHGRSKPMARTLFATHFHQLTEIEAEFKRVKNYHFAVKDEGRDVVFLRKLIPGATDKSYGLHVARLAGVPGKIVDRAEEILKEVEDIEYGRLRKVPRFTQMLFLDPIEVNKEEKSPVLEELEKLELDKMTPIDALNTLYNLQKLAKNGKDGGG
jgi:DNA mismatch repair protein MutS